MRQFLQKHVINGGSIPRARQLKQCYLSRKMDDHNSKVLEIVKDKPVSIICDEMSDDIGRFVLNILAAPLEPADADNRVKSYLLDTVFLEKTNHSTVSGAVVECLVRCGIDFNNVITFNSDNAQYMKKAYKDVLKGLMTNSVHVTCMAHIMALSFRKPFDRSNKYVKAANAVFWNAGARKGRHIRFLKEHSVSPKMPPNPIGTRWNCWFDAVRYHKTHLRHFQAFIWEEIEHCQNSEPESVLYLAEVFKDKDHVDCLEAEFSSIGEKCQEFVWSNMEDLQRMFGSCGISLTDASRYFPDDMTQSSKMSLQSLFCQAFSAVADKLDKYMTVEGQPGIEFLKQVPLFDPSRLVVFESGLNALPGLKDVPSDEIKK